MAPSVFTPKSLAWSALPVAVFLSYLWLKKKRVEFPSEVDLSEPKVCHPKESEIKELRETQALLVTPRKSTRSLSGVESAPIDISYPPELRLTNSIDYVPDEDLDTELRRASSSNIFDRYQAVNQSEQKDSAFYKPSQHLDQIDQIPIEEKQILLKSQSLEENVFVQSDTANMTQFDTSSHSEASQPEQGDILSQSFQNGMMAHENSHISNESSTQIESVDKLKTSNYAGQLKEASQTAEIPEEVAQTAEIPEEVAQTAEIPEEVAQTADILEEITPTVEPSKEATIPVEVSDEAFTPVEPQEVSSTVESADEVSSLVETPKEVSPTIETPKEVSLPAENPEEVSSTVEISDETQTIEPVSNNVDQNIEDGAAESRTENIPKSTGAIPKTGKKKKQKYRPLPLETITGGKTQSYSRNKRRNERRPNYTHTAEFAEEVLRKTSERATAKSPTSASSSSISSIAESTDSGKGCSETASSPPACRLSPTDETKNEITSYSFTIPHKFVGLLKGSQCAHINKIKRTAHVDIDLMITNPRATNPARKQQLCTLRGTKKEIDHALSLIKERFPRQRYPEITFIPVECPRPYTKPNKIPIQHTYLQLADHISNDTVVACMEAPDHLYMHLHLSPSHNELPFYTNYMKELYSTEKEDQYLPQVVPVGSGCVALFYDNWYRAQILSTNQETNTSVIKLLDYGGVEVISNNCLRQYHYTLMGLPFQAIECYLYNVKPKGESWCPKAYECISQLTTGVMVQTHVVRYRDNIPEVIVIVPHIDSKNDVCINHELVRNNLADYISIEDVTCQEDDVENLPPADCADSNATYVA